VTCHEVNELLAAYLDDELPAETRRAFSEHLTACRDCRAYLESYRATIALAKAAFGCDDPVSSTVPEELVAAILKARAKDG